MNLRPARLGPSELARVGGAGLRVRPLRSVLSALGIAIGIAAMVAVVGVSASSRADLERQIAALGTDLLTVSPGHSLFGEQASLPAEAIPMIQVLGGTASVSATGLLPETKVYRNDHIPKAESGGITVVAARPGLAATVGAHIAEGADLNAASERYPTVVLGARAADRLGVGPVGADQQVELGHQLFTVVGVLAPAPLAPELDTSALVGWPVATTLLGFDGHPTTVYVKARPGQVEATQRLLARAANPAAPNEVDVSRHSDALAAQQAADATLNALLLGLGAVALLIGGIGVANTMVISVLERRGEIGLRRALGATRGDVRNQFLVEALLLSAAGGLGGLLLGAGATIAYAASRGWPAVVPPWAMLAAAGTTLLIGAAAGLYPAARAARLTPTEALSAA